MAQNFLYMFEFVIDDLLITKPNDCAPEEYPVCAEILFRSSVYVNISESDFCGCMDPCAPKKQGKCSMFGLECPVTETDLVHVHIYKKRARKCKFLLGSCDVCVVSLFDKVTSDFICENKWDPDMMEEEDPDIFKSKFNKLGMSMTCDVRNEEYCPTSAIEKKLLALYNLQGKQSGNIVLIVRLSCMGPSIVTPFPFTRKTKYCPPCPPKDESGCPVNKDPCPPKPRKICCYLPECKECCCMDIECCKPCCVDESKCGSKGGGDQEACDCLKQASSCCPPPPPCCCPPPPCCPPPCPPPPCCPPPCCPPPDLCDPPPCTGCVKCASAEKKECYDEYRAELNGKEITLRIPKEGKSGNDSCNKKKASNYDSDICKLICSDKDFLYSTFFKNKIRARTTGKYINNCCIPYIKGNLKYASDDACGQTIKCPKPKNQRNCCLQITENDIDNLMTGAGKKPASLGIETCPRKYAEDSNVISFKINPSGGGGGGGACGGGCGKKNDGFEIELKTPKSHGSKNKHIHSLGVQVEEKDLNAQMIAGCGKKKK